MSYVQNQIPVHLRSRIYIDYQKVWKTVRLKEQDDNEQMLDAYQLSESLGFALSPVSNIFKVGCYYTCYADRFYTTIINYDRKIHGCTARDYKPDSAIGQLSKDGKIIWNEAKLSKQKGKATFENENCLNCKYLPLCMGPCSHKLFESNGVLTSNVCPLNISEVSILTFMKDYYYKYQSKLHSLI